MAHRRVLGAGVVLGDHDHGRGQQQADERGAEQRFAWSRRRCRP